MSKNQQRPASTLGEVSGTLDQLKKEFDKGPAKGTSGRNLEKCGKLLDNLKIQLSNHSVLVPIDPKTISDAAAAWNVPPLLLARETLEIGALWSICIQDIASFDRHMSQLKTFYQDYKNVIPESPRMYYLLGVNLLRLLSENRIAEFHTELETIPPVQLLENIFISHPLKIEQSLMEGSYNKVWNARAVVPAEEYSFFMNRLMETIRHDIAKCTENAYSHLPIHDAANMLYFENMDNFRSFAKERQWSIDDKQKRIFFGKAAAPETKLETREIIADALRYVQELERIV